MQLSDPLLSWLENWGKGFYGKFEQAFKNATDSKPFLPCFNDLHRGPSGSHPGALRVGTDCSGVESPLFALMALGVDHQHLFSCENAKAARDVIAANTLPEKAFFSDVLASNVEDAPFVDLYVAGFSCKPFSLLHNRTKLLEEPEAKIFFAVVTRIKRLQPPVFVLENVTGIKRCMPRVMSELEACGYMVLVQELNPLHLGEPVSRPRLYFIGLRNGVSRGEQADCQFMYDHVWSRLQCPSGSAVPLSHRLLHADHPWVVRSQEDRRKKWVAAQEQGFPDPSPKRTKWREQHANWLKQRGVEQRSCQREGATPTPDELLLHLPRERDLWQNLVMTTNLKPEELVADISQSLGRVPVRSSSLPTITPGAHIIVGEAKRALSPCEKLLMHGLPLHRMSLPESISDSDLETMGGQMMHLQTVGFAMLIGLALVDWMLPGARKPVEVEVTPPKRSKGSSSGPSGSMRQLQKKGRVKREFKVEAKLRARFGMPIQMGKVSKPLVSKKKAKVCKAKQPQQAVHLACLRGTRWAS